MNFLDKFKGKTTFLKKLQVKEILGQRTQTQIKRKDKADVKSQKYISLSQKKENISEKFGQSLSKNPIIMNKNSMKNSKIKQTNLNPQSSSQLKKVIQNPFLVQNQFYLDEEQQKLALKKRKQKQISERIEKQRKKRQQIENIMLKSLQKASTQSAKITKKQWVKLGGLGPNIGGQQWTIKKRFQQKMNKFAQQVKNKNKMNQEKEQVLKSNSIKSQKITKKDAASRDLALKYSKTVQKPSSYILQKTRYNQIQIIQSKISEKSTKIFPNIHRKSLLLQQNPVHLMENEFNQLKIQRNYSQLQKYQDKHKQYKKLIYENF